VIAAGDVVRRQDAPGDLLVVVLSNSMHIMARTGRVITCPYVPGTVADDAMALVVGVDEPPGTLLAELVQWLPAAALSDPIGNVGPDALARASAIVVALIGP
jgi:mRNA-degrading endonuclease toxin of MazEF toxin-antitoxin module